MVNSYFNVRVTAGAGLRASASRPASASPTRRPGRPSPCLPPKPVATISDLTGDSFRNSFNISVCSETT